MTKLLRLGALAGALGLAACGGEDLVLPSEGEPAAIAIVQGDGQSGRAGEALPQPLIFEVTDGTGRPVQDATVVIEVAGAAPEPDTASTDETGLAVVGLVLGPEVGTTPGTARVLTPEGRPPVAVDFAVSAVASSANGLSVVSGADQTALAGAAVPEPLVVRVTDAFGNPIEGVAITWAAEGGGSLSATGTTTDAEGLAAVTRVLGSTAGLQRTIASSPGLAGSPAVFLHTATPGSATGVQIESGNGQSGLPGSRLPEPLVVRVTDADGNPVPSAPVTWVVTAGGGQLDPSTSTTDADGRASTAWVLGPAAGANTAEAVVSGVGSATFTATATAGTASGLEIVSGDGQTAESGRQLPAELVVRVTDPSGNPVSGATVGWRVLSGGGSVTSGSSTTDGSGLARTRWTLGGGVGEQTVEASLTGAGSVTFRATATAGAPSVLGLRTQPSGTARAGVPFDRQPVVQLRDAAGNDVAQAGVAVTVAIATGPGSLGGTTTRTTDGSGRAAFTDLEIGSAIGTHALIFAASGFTSVTSDPIEVRAVGTTTRIVSATPDPSSPGEAVTVRFEVTSPGGTPTGTVRVTTSAGSESCSAPVSAGSCDITPGTAGDQTLTVAYEGGGIFEPSSAAESHTVEAPNADPAAQDDQYTTGVDQVLEVPAPGVLGNDSDPDGDALVAERSSDPGSGTLELNSDGSFRFTPASGFTGPVTFTYRALDGQGGEATATVTVTVQ